jgi:hypothetical protein
MKNLVLKSLSRILAEMGVDPVIGRADPSAQGKGIAWVFFHKAPFRACCAL